MQEFKNQLIIREEKFENKLFVKIPNFQKNGSAFLLTNGNTEDLLLDAQVTSKMIRQGKYTKLVEISTRQYIKEIHFDSPSKEIAYNFAIYVKATIQVKNPIRFYENKNLDVDAYFENLFSMDIRKITRKYSILDFAGLDDELKEQLSQYNTVDESTGFEYQVSVVDARLNTDAEEYVKRNAQMELEAEMNKRAKELAEGYDSTFGEAIRIEMAQGKISPTEGFVKIEEFKNSNYQRKIKQFSELLEAGLITSQTAKESIKAILKQNHMLEEGTDNKIESNKVDIDKLYIEGEQ